MTLAKALLPHSKTLKNIQDTKEHETGIDIQTAKKMFKWPKNREDSSDLDENLTESIAAMKTII